MTCISATTFGDEWRVLLKRGDRLHTEIIWSRERDVMKVIERAKRKWRAALVA